MIVLLSSLLRERSAFAAVCDARNWAYSEADSIRSFKKICQRIRPRVALVRYQLSDGYSDDALALLSAQGSNPPTHVIVLLDANASSAIEVRQIGLGADCIQRDPVRTEVIVAYLEKYRKENAPKLGKNSPSGPSAFRFANAEIDPVERTLTHAGRTVRLTPREVELSQLLAHSGELVSYETLYGEILGRKFRGETSNLRVLLGKLDRSARSTGLEIRRWIEVIPKLGYRYATEKTE